MTTRRCIIAIALVSAFASVAVAEVCATVNECVKRCSGGEKEACISLGRAAEQACKQGDGTGCALAASLHADALIGDSATRAEMSADFWRRGCELDDGDSCGSWGYALIYGEGTTRDEAGGLAAWKKSCKLKSPLGCLNIGGRMMKGVGVHKDEPAAAEALTFACDHDERLACELLGELYFAGVKGRPNVEKARTAFQAACKLGSSDACAQAEALGAEGGAVDLKVETANYRKACENENHLPSCNAYGQRLIDGRGVRRNRKRGLAVRTRACRDGYAIGCSNLGHAWLAGEGFKQDLKKAAEYLELGCRGGVSEACHDAGWLHTSAPGAKHDAERGFA